jgi:hypothetical protein
MSLLLSDVLDGFLLAGGVLMIVSALLQRAGITSWFNSPRGPKGRPLPVGASLLSGAGFVVTAATNLIPDGHQPNWGLMVLLRGLAFFLFLGSLVMFAISPRNPGPVNPEHT